MDSIRAISTISTPIPARAINTPPSHNAYPQYCNGLRGMMRRHGADSKRSAETCSKGKKEAGPRRAPLRTYMEVPSTGQRRPALPRASPAVPSALGGLASGFGMGPGVPRPPWPLTGGRRSAHREVVMCVRADPRALGAAQRGDGPWGSTSDPTGSIARHPSLARRHPRRYEMLG